MCLAAIHGSDSLRSPAGPSPRPVRAQYAQYEGQGGDDGGGDGSGHDDHDQDHGQEDHDVVVKPADPQLREPSKYAAILLNDDYSTMEFVVEVLQKFFQKNREEALQIMIRVHHEGRGVAGIYTRDIAETKAAQVQELARTQGFPLKCIIEKQ